MPGAHEKEVQDALENAIANGSPASASNPIHVTDDGTHTNPEKYRQANHWGSGEEIQIIVAGLPGAVNLGNAVPAGKKRRIREITARFSGSDDVTLYLYESSTTEIRLSFTIQTQSTRLWSSQDGRKFAAGEQAQIYADSVVGGTLYVTAAGLEI